LEGEGGGVVPGEGYGGLRKEGSEKDTASLRVIATCNIRLYIPMSYKKRVSRDSSVQVGKNEKEDGHRARSQFQLKRGEIIY